jgi:hypothetical protein
MGLFAVHRAAGSLSALALGRVEAVRDAKKAAVEAMAGKWLAAVRIYAGVKEVYHAVAMGRDAFMGVKKGERADVADTAYQDTRNFVIGAFLNPLWRSWATRTRLVVDDYGRVLFAVGGGAEVGGRYKRRAVAGLEPGRGMEKGPGRGDGVRRLRALSAAWRGTGRVRGPAPPRPPGQGGGRGRVARAPVPTCRDHGPAHGHRRDRGEFFGGRGRADALGFLPGRDDPFPAGLVRLPGDGKVETQAAKTPWRGERTGPDEDFRGVRVVVRVRAGVRGRRDLGLWPRPTRRRPCRRQRIEPGRAGLGLVTVVVVLATTAYFLRREFLRPFAATGAFAPGRRR